MATTIQQLKPKREATNWMCSSCGEDASCNCGAPLMSKAQRAAEAIRRDPSKSDRAIAKEIGTSNHTVAAARRSSTGSNFPVEETRTGLDGKQRKMPSKPTEEAAEQEYAPAPYKKRTKTDVVVEDLTFALGLATEASRYSGPVPKKLIELADKNVAAFQQLATKWQAG